MKTKPGKEIENTDAHKFARTYVVEMTPRTWWGRAIVVAVLAVVLSFAFLFFSLLVAIGIAIVALAVLVRMLKYIAKTPHRCERQIDQDKPRVIDTERSEHDGVYKPRDSSTS